MSQASFEVPKVEEVSDEELEIGDVNLKPAPVVETSRSTRASSKPREPVMFKRSARIASREEEPVSIGISGDREVGGKNGVLASVCVVERDFFERYCGAVKGSGEKICAVSDCMVSSHRHQRNKAALERGTFLIGVGIGTTKAYVLSEPRLLAHQVPRDEDFSEWFHQTQPASLLVRQFSDRIDSYIGSPSEASGDSQHVSWDDAAYEKLPSMSEMAATIKEFTTPNKVQAMIKTEKNRIEMDKMKQIKLFEESLDIGPSPLPGLVDGMDEGPLKDLLASVTDCLVDQENKIQTLNKNLVASQAQIQQNLGRISEVSTVAQQALLLIGECPSDKPELLSASVWKRIASMSEAEKEREDVMLEVTAAMEDLDTAQRSVNKKIKSLNERFQIVIPNLQQRMDIQDAKQVPPSDSPPSKHIEEELHQMRATIVDLNADNMHWKRMEGSMAPETTARLMTLEAELSDCRRVLRGNNTYSYNDQVFGSVADVERLLGESLGNASIGDFLDIYTLLCLAQDSFVDGKTYADKSRSAFNIKSTNMEVDIMSTMSHPAPLTLFGKGEGKSALVAPEEGFGFRLKDFGMYSGRHVNSFRQDIQKKSNHIIASVRGSVKGSGAAAQLSKHLSVESRNHLSELLGHWSDWHEEMVEQCGYTSNDAWCFIGFTARCVMDHLVPPRMEIAAIGNLDSARSKALVIWAVMQVHIRIEEIIEAKFKSHHVVTTAMSNFVMKTRVDRSQVAAVASKVTDATKLVAQCEKKVATLEAELKSFKQSQGNKIANLGKKKGGEAAKKSDI